MQLNTLFHKHPDGGLAIVRRAYAVHRRQWRSALLLVLLVILGAAGTAGAQASSSAHYGVSEVQFGAGSSLHDCSANYCAKTSVGDTAVGRAGSANYIAWAGFNTTDQPLLEVVTSGGTADMGVLDVQKTGTAVGTIKIRSYLSNGYVLQITGPSPTQGKHNLDTPAAPTPSQQGYEQFGINLAANTTPAIGAAPVQIPDDTFSYGAVADNYKQPNQYMYQDGDIVARSPTSTGETDFTVSFIINISNVTPAGRYNGSFSAVAVPIY